MIFKFFKKILGWFILLAMTQGSIFVLAQTQPTILNQTVTLDRYVNQTNGLTADDAVRFAIENNGELAAMQKELEASHALVKQARLRPNPTIEASRAEQIGGKDSQLMVAGTLPIELGGRRNTRILVAERENAVRENAVADRERLLAAEVRLKFGEALAQTFKLKFTEEILESALQGFRLVQARVTEGKIAPLEENMTLVEVNRLRSIREIEAGKTEIVFLELRSLLGMKPEEPLHIHGDFENLIAPLPLLAETTTRALQIRPDFLAMRAGEDLAEAQIEQAQSESRVDASVTAGYQRMNSSFPVNGINAAGNLSPVRDVFHFFTFGITLQLPLRNRNQGAIEAAVANRDAAQKRREFAELVVRREVAAAFARYTSNARAMEIFRVGVRGQASENLNVIRQTYELGSKTLLEYISEDRRYIEIENEFIDAQLAVYQARVEILRVTFAPELIKK